MIDSRLHNCINSLKPYTEINNYIFKKCIYISDYYLIYKILSKYIDDHFSIGYLIPNINKFNVKDIFVNSGFPHALYKILDIFVDRDIVFVIFGWIPNKYIELFKYNDINATMVDRKSLIINFLDKLIDMSNYIDISTIRFTLDLIFFNANTNKVIILGLSIDKLLKSNNINSLICRSNDGISIVNDKINNSVADILFYILTKKAPHRNSWGIEFATVNYNDKRIVTRYNSKISTRVDTLIYNLYSDNIHKKDEAINLNYVRAYFDKHNLTISVEESIYSSKTIFYILFFIVLIIVILILL